MKNNTRAYLRKLAEIKDAKDSLREIERRIVEAVLDLEYESTSTNSVAELFRLQDEHYAATAKLAELRSKA